jgi:transposase
MTQTPPPAETVDSSSRAGKPLTQAELDQARRWRTTGSSITAIAKHLQRSRGTIKAYLDGVRAPGHRRKPPPRADPFPAFADYCSQRLADDPHLETRPLHRELVKLGYPLSYQALWRHLQANGINTSGCSDCRRSQKPLRQAATSALEDISALPMPVALVNGEILSSYLQRLAVTNHITVADLLAVLPPWFRTKVPNHDDRVRHHMLAHIIKDALTALAMLTKTPADQLARALPAFGSHDLPDPVRATHACHKCLAAISIRHQVPVHMPGYQHICLRHRLWIGPAGIPQLDLTSCPAITHAQRHALKLMNRFGAEQLMFAQLAAERDVRNLPYRPTPEPPRHHWRHRLQRLRNTNPQADTAIAHDQFIRAALYPDAIARAATTLEQSRTTAQT